MTNQEVRCSTGQNNQSFQASEDHPPVNGQDRSEAEKGQRWNLGIWEPTVLIPISKPLQLQSCSSRT